MERQSKGLRDLEAYCKGGQDPPWAVAPLKRERSGNESWIQFLITKEMNDICEVTPAL